MRRTPPHDRRALAALSFTQLTTRYPHHARMLLWLRACWLIRREQLQTLGWPQPTTPQNRNQGLRRLTAARLIEAVDDEAQVFKLGRHGATILQHYGLATPYRTNPKSSSRPGLMLAGEFAVALGLELMQHRNILALSWSEQPFAGTIVRPDASAALRSGIRPDTAPSPWVDILKPEASWPLTPHERTIRLFLEVDRVSQFSEKIADRMQSWASATHHLSAASLPPQTVQLVLWITTGTWRRVATLRRLWNDYTHQRALFTTCYQLRGEQEAGVMHPLQAFWSSSDGFRLAGEDLFAFALNRP